MLGAVAGCQGEKLDETPVVAPRLNELVRFAGNADQGRFVEHVTLRGLALHHADWELSPSGQLILSPTVSAAETNVLKAEIGMRRDIATVCGTRMLISPHGDQASSARLVGVQQLADGRLEHRLSVGRDRRGSRLIAALPIGLLSADVSGPSVAIAGNGDELFGGPVPEQTVESPPWARREGVKPSGRR